MSAEVKHQYPLSFEAAPCRLTFNGLPLGVLREGGVFEEIAWDRPSLDALSEQIAAHVSPVRRHLLHVVSLTADKFEVPSQAMLAGSREREVAFARFVAIVLLTEFLPSTPKRIITKAFGKDRSLVSYSVREVRNRASVDVAFRVQVDALRAQLRDYFGWNK